MRSEAPKMEDRVDVLDKGYVRLVTWTPWNMVGLYNAIMDGDMVKAAALLDQDDLAFVNAARASFMVESDSLEQRDINLLRFLVDRYETEPFRHAMLTIEIRAPLFVRAQWFKYRVGAVPTPHSLEAAGITPEVFAAMTSGANGDDGAYGDPLHARSEASGRYVNLGLEFYRPRWRSAPENKKQGSGGDIDEVNQDAISIRYGVLINKIVDFVEYAQGAGVAQEMIRGIYPQNTYTTWRWSGSLQAYAFFLAQRLAGKAQHEIQDYARAVHTLVQPCYPHSLDLLLSAMQKLGGER